MQYSRRWPHNNFRHDIRRVKYLHKINLHEAKDCLASLVREVADGEEVIITEESGLAFKLVLMGKAPGLQDYNRGKLFNPEVLWEQTEPITTEDIAEVRNEVWRKFDQGPKI